MQPLSSINDLCAAWHHGAEVPTPGLRGSTLTLFAGFRLLVFGCGFASVEDGASEALKEGPLA